MRSWELKGQGTYKQRKRAPISFFVLMKPLKNFDCFGQFFFQTCWLPIGNFSPELSHQIYFSLTEETKVEL